MQEFQPFFKGVVKNWYYFQNFLQSQKSSSEDHSGKAGGLPGGEARAKSSVVWAERHHRPHTCCHGQAGTGRESGNKVNTQRQRTTHQYDILNQWQGHCVIHLTVLYAMILMSKYLYLMVTTGNMLSKYSSNWLDKVSLMPSSRSMCQQMTLETYRSSSIT